MDIAHYSIMKEEVCSFLAPEEDGQLLIDCTMGEGGHSKEFLTRYPSLNVIGLDADEKIQEIARERLAPFGDRVRFVHTWFDRYFDSYGEPRRPDRILIDLGISMFHYERSGRGFTFRKDEPLDMRLDPGNPLSAEKIINTYSESDLADVIYKYGEERYSRRIASAIVRKREEAPVVTAAELADVVYHAVPGNYRHGRIHPATRTFQAVRIEVNGELDRLQRVLEGAVRNLAVGGRIGIITFHSLEDRLVKHFFKDLNRDCICPPEQPRCTCGGARILDILTRKPVVPTEEEVRENSPSRSAKFRVARKVAENSIRDGKGNAHV